VTHDIKGHLAAIISTLGVVRSGITGHLNEEQSEFINRAYERTNLLGGFVRDLLNLTRKRLNREIEFEEVVLPELIAKVISSVSLQSSEKSLKLNTIIDPEINSIEGNPLTLEELYTNLLLNSIKYTPPEGKIYLTVRNQGNQILNEILDTGIGIPETDIGRVFDEFYRAGNVPKDSKTGSGLGLSICKQIVENHKGRIRVASKEGEWTKFSFTLPKNQTMA
jgi:signal transduction histidine kinase